MAFDPYQEWLGLDGGRPHAFSLLGVSPRETSDEVIRRAADERLSRIRAIRPGEHVEAWSKLIDEITQARDLLLDPEQRAAYIERLKSRRAAQVAATVPMAGSVNLSERVSVKSAREPSSETVRATSATRTAMTSVTPAPASQAADPFDPMAPLAPSPVPIRSAALNDSPANGAAPSHLAVGADPGAPIPAGHLAATPVAPVGAPAAPVGGPSMMARHKERARKGRGTALMMLVALIVFLGSVAGVGYVYRGPLMAALSPKPAEPAAPAENDPAEAPENNNTDSSTPNNGGDSNNGTSTTDDSDSTPSTDPPVIPEDSDLTDPDSESETPEMVPEMDPEMTPEDPEVDLPDPEMEMQPEDEEGEEPSRRLTRPEGFALANLLRSALEGLKENDEAKVDAILEEATVLAADTEESQWVDRLRIVVNTNRRFWEEVATCCAELESTEVLDVTPTLQVAVVEASEERLVYRVNGTREERAPRDLPPGLARFIVEKVREGDDDAQRLIGALYAAESATDGAVRDKAETAWRAADAAGIDVRPLLGWLADDYDDLIERFPPAEVPTAEQLESVMEATKTELEELLDKARTPVQKVAAAFEVVEQATALDATPEAYARFQIATDLIASTGQSTHMEKALQLWSSWFKLDRLSVDSALLARCAKAAADPEECKNTVAMAMQGAQQAIGRKRVEEAEIFLDAANDAAQKSRDAELRNATLQQTRTLRMRLEE